MIDLNCIGLKCPEPVMMLRKTVRKMEDGETLEVVTDDPSTKRDFPAFCEHMDHTLISSCEENDTFKFVIKKGM
ncbi:sulfurtransferase TusA [Vibrio crassostreae]|uniref:sulfurtransferase TusA n=1 Tax=Vibrio crassostreae TaxID=246167 RepID=UPI001B315AA8|nr:sulfurtransferase TusA [Vibrio crassostreae]